jgi:hypothetical protein
MFNILNKIKSFFTPKIKPVEEQPLDTTTLSPESWPFPTNLPADKKGKKQTKKSAKAAPKKPAKITSKK